MMTFNPVRAETFRAFIREIQEEAEAERSGAFDSRRFQRKLDALRAY